MTKEDSPCDILLWALLTTRYVTQGSPKKQTTASMILLAKLLCLHVTFHLQCNKVIPFKIKSENKVLTIVKHVQLKNSPLWVVLVIILY